MIKETLIILSLTLTSAAYPIYPLKPVAQEQVNNYTTDHNIGGIEIQGEINSHTADVVKEAFKVFEDKGFKHVVIHLNSPGGDVDAGADIVKEMITAETKYGMTVSTYVDHKEYCASMCTGVFAAGNFRVAAWDSTWVFHSPFAATSDGKQVTLTQEDQDELNACRHFLMTLYESVDPDWADKVLKPHIMQPNNPLRLTAVQIIDQSPWWFDYILED